MIRNIFKKVLKKEECVEKSGPVRHRISANGESEKEILSYSSLGKTITER